MRALMVLPGLLVAWLTTIASAEFEAIGRKGVGNLVGVRSRTATEGSCSDSTHATQGACEGASETWTAGQAAVSSSGIYEIVGAQTLLAGAIVGMVVISAGFMLFRRWLRRATG